VWLTLDLFQTKLAPLVTRFAAEVTPEVGPPFYTFLISPSNQIEIIKNDNFSPVDKEEVKQKLKKLDYDM
jgi:ABC-type thiamine transport system substrate-binding protein